MTVPFTFAAFCAAMNPTPDGLVPSPGVGKFPRGRRLRVLARLLPRIPERMSLLEFMVAAEGMRPLCDPYGKISLRVGNGVPFDWTSTGMLTEIQPEPGHGNASLHYALQDLGYDILEDIQEACEAHFNGKHYARVSSGIEPVPDKHVRLVMWAMQRELDRELRYRRDGSGVFLPSVKLNTFTWPIQRALAERRRLRYQQFGIGRQQWLDNSWSLWDVPEDPGYASRREARGLAEVNDARRPGEPSVWPAGWEGI